MAHNIGIIGAGFAGLHLALMLQKNGAQTTLYADRTAAELNASRMMGIVARFPQSIRRERELGVFFWEQSGFNCDDMRVSIEGEFLLNFAGHLDEPSSFVDPRIYFSTLLNVYQLRGGNVVFGRVERDDMERLSEQHDLMVVASGRGTMIDMFPRIPERSPYTLPQRALFAGIFNGVRPLGDRGFTFFLLPGIGEIFVGQLHTFSGNEVSMLFEAVPGSPMSLLPSLNYADDPQAFNAAVLNFIQEYVPGLFEHIDPENFGVLREQDMMQGAIVPTVRQGWSMLGNRKPVLALGDVHITNDPITGQGANTAIMAAWMAGEAILQAETVDVGFCVNLSERIWRAAEPVVQWSNAFLQPPPQHILGLMIAAMDSSVIADTFVNNFTSPAKQWELLSSPANVAALIEANRQPELA